MRLTGIEIKNFRSIGSTSVSLKPLRKCSILVGRNNAGKSNVIKSIQAIQKMFQNPQWSVNLNMLDRHRRSETTEFECTLYFGADESPVDDHDKDLLTLFKTEEYFFSFSEKHGHQGLQVIDSTFANIEDFNISNNLMEKVENIHWTYRVQTEDIRKHFLEKGKTYYQRFFNKPILRPIVLIPEFRRIEPGTEYSVDGKNLVQELARWQNPIIGRDTDRSKFERIEELIKRLIHLPEARLDIPRDDPTIIIETNNSRLPLSSYGTGIHQLIILVTAVMSFENTVCCIEEPEIHLHPTLQRDFLEFITRETSNQYILSTHSSTLINANLYMKSDIRDQIQVFNLRSINGDTVCIPVVAGLASVEALNDLGVKASDILQTNSVIWVEGPSDRIYLNRWLEILAPDLIEGLHYSIMFYGGKVLSHFSFERSQKEGKVPKELIEIVKINQRAIVVIDSDKKQPSSKINLTKSRIKDECKQNDNVCWITQGREIENYLPIGAVTKACKQMTGVDLSISFNLYDKFEDQLDAATTQAKTRKLNYAANKVDFARKFIPYFQETEINKDLKKQLGMIIAKIRLWNE